MAHVPVRHGYFILKMFQQSIKSKNGTLQVGQFDVTIKDNWLRPAPRDMSKVQCIRPIFPESKDKHEQKSTENTSGYVRLFKFNGKFYFVGNHILRLNIHYGTV